MLKIANPDIIKVSKERLFVIVNVFSKILREELGNEIQLVTPGIRSNSSPADDQKRTMSPAEAIKAGASWLVIGRPITLAENPRAAAIDILNSIDPEVPSD